MPRFLGRDTEAGELVRPEQGSEGGRALDTDHSAILTLLLLPGSRLIRSLSTRSLGTSAARQTLGGLQRPSRTVGGGGKQHGDHSSSRR